MVRLGALLWGALVPESQRWALLPVQTPAGARRPSWAVSVAPPPPICIQAALTVGPWAGRAPHGARGWDVG